MKKIILFFLFPFVLIAQNAKETPIKVTTANAHHVVLDLQNKEQVINIKTTGVDPYIFTKPLRQDLNSTQTVVTFEYFCPKGLDFIELYFYPLSSVILSKKVGDVGSTEAWVPFSININKELKQWGKKGDFLRLDFGSNPNVNIQIRNIRFRPITQREIQVQAQREQKKQEELVLEQSIKEYLNTNNTKAILSNVLVKDNTIEINGSVSKNFNEKIYLAEVAPYEDITAIKKFNIVKCIDKKKHTVTTSVKRISKREGFTYDRALSKWVLLRKNNKKYEPISKGHFADSIIPKHTYAFSKPATKKGLGGFAAKGKAPASDLDDLGISSVTVNIFMNTIFRSTPGPKHIPFTYMGQTFYAHEPTLKRYDATLKLCASKNIEVSAITLFAKASQSPDKKIGEILQHPDCDPAGVYTMPNVTDSKGVHYYAAFIDFLANRYTRPDKKYGRIHHWIIHNEVDAGWVWTNAGEKTATVYMDLYYKSMRITNHIVKQYHSSSKVFISLTHYWNWTSNPNFYLSKELLEQLLKYSKIEGDFDWAIAQHPYPESLREPKTWLDKNVSYNFNTPLITFKNLEVLGAWVQQPEVLYKGKTKRLLYLSENGTNSPTYSKQDMKEQAAGLAYALKKMSFIDAIDGFQYHNWQDNRKEGGLRIGLRKFPDDAKDPGGIKPAWHVYKAYGTKQEDKVFNQYLKLIGIGNWQEIIQKVDIK